MLRRETALRDAIQKTRIVCMQVITRSIRDSPNAVL